MTGKRAVAGIEATTCTIGWAREASRRFMPMATPAGTVHASAMARAAATRSKVAARPIRSGFHEEKGSVARSPNAR